MNVCRRDVYLMMGLVGAACAGSPAMAEDLVPITLTTTWYAQAEHGGMYAAKAEGIYEEHGLDVTIEPGGPNVNNVQLLAAGNSDFTMGYSLQSLNAVKEGVPLVTVAAFFQKDPQTLVVHEGQGYNTLKDLRGAPARVPAAGRQSYWPWLVQEFGLDENQLRPYDYNFAPFIRDEESIQQGYITNDGYMLAREGVEVDAKSLLLADFGWDAYSATLDTTRQMIEENPEVVQAMVAATAEGWAAYFENPEAANELILDDNPDMEPELIAYSIDKMQSEGILLSGAAEGGGYGIMTRNRWQSFFDDMVAAGILDEGLGWQAAFDLQFVQALYD